jgi:hypothetical protein
MNDTRRRTVALSLGAALGLHLLAAPPAAACGCFTPPDPSVPVVQAGERIAFALQNGQVTAHIQIQYQGNATDFGWLLPLPSVPTLELGTDELFTQLTAQTQPKYKLNTVYNGNCSFGPNGRAGGGFAPGAPTANATQGPTDGTTDPSPLVYQNSVGPYDYAVLKADSKDDMLNWLAQNRYFVPAGTDDTVAPYIHPGAFFLALKLKSGNSAGDIQPVVVHYASDLPMIPIVLTSVAAKPDMGIQVWMLGNGRAIPRNYYHTVINDAKLDWLNGAQNYNDVIIAATKEAEGRHTFVTEYAGTSIIMRNLLNSPGRFGSGTDLAAQPDEISFVQYLNSHGYAYTSQLTGTLAHYIPVPDTLTQQGITAANFYQSISYWLGSYRQQNPSAFVGYTTDYRPTQIASDILDRVVMPTLKAGALFDEAPYLTRLYTTLSPENMNKDPVFSYNASLPVYNNIHTGTLTYECSFFGSDNPSTTPAIITTEEGWTVDFPSGTGPLQSSSASGFSPPPGPYSERVEILGEEGAPQVVTDNSGSIQPSIGNGGCDVAASRRGASAAGAIALALMLGVWTFRRRKTA